MESYGGKADHLIRLKNAGFHVPAFFVIREDSKAADLVAALRDFVRPGETYAVRSSASVEDTAGTAMAGLFETFLNVSAADLVGKVEDCFASAGAQRVRDYLEARGIREAVRMSVIVQKMVRAELSGVLFTANPLGILNEMTAILGEGPGDLVVEAKIPVTTLIHHFQDDVDLVIRAQDTPPLEEALARELMELALRLKAEFTMPMDAEFSIEAGKLWLLQARPITSLADTRPTILDNSNISESYPGITLPLSIDFARTAYAGIFHGLVAGILGEPTAAEMEAVLGEMVTASSGRMYYQINNWYKLMKLLPLSSLYIPVWQEMMGVVNREVETEEIHLKPMKNLMGIGRFLRAFQTTSARMQRLDEDFRTFRQYFRAVMDGDPDQTRLIDLFEEMKETLLDQWDVTLLNDLQAFVFTAALKKRLKHKGNRRLVRKLAGARSKGSTGKEKAAEKDLNLAITQIGELESLRPIRLLSRIARVAPADFLELETEDQVQNYLKEEGPFPKILRDYLDDYGDRYLEELKLESRTFRTNPGLLQEAIRRLRDDHFRGDGRQSPADGSARGAVPGLSQPSANSWLYQKAVQGIRNREISRLNRTRIFGMARELFLRLGEGLVKAGSLAETRDVFWLDLSQVLQVKPRDHKAMVSERKQMYEEYRKLPVFTRLVFAGRPFDRILPGAGELSRHPSGVPVLLGTGASPGLARGQVLVVEAPADVKDTFGKILVTRQTDPGWVFLMANSAGLISERGSLLSHTAIIARELGKPAIVGLIGAVDLFRSGETVEMNGSTGQITRIEP